MSNQTVNHVLHKKSVVVEDGRPKLPTKDQIEYGEIAVNYAKDVESLTTLEEIFNYDIKQGYPQVLNFNV